MCGAWSFDNAEGKCYLHTVDGCCGQFGKQEANSDWISGYVCPHCWSTKGNTDCTGFTDCTIKKRAVIPKTAHGAGGKSPLHATSSVSKLKILLKFHMKVFVIVTYREKIGCCTDYHNICRAQLLCKVYPGVRTNVNVFLKGPNEVGSVASNLLVQNLLRRK